MQKLGVMVSAVVVFSAVLSVGLADPANAAGKVKAMIEDSTGNDCTRVNGQLACKDANTSTTTEDTKTGDKQSTKTDQTDHQ